MARWAQVILAFLTPHHLLPTWWTKLNKLFKVWYYMLWVIHSRLRRSPAHLQSCVINLFISIVICSSLEAVDLLKMQVYMCLPTQISLIWSKLFAEKKLFAPNQRNLNWQTHIYSNFQQIHSFQGNHKWHLTWKGLIHMIGGELVSCRHGCGSPITCNIIFWRVFSIWSIR